MPRPAKREPSFATEAELVAAFAKALRHERSVWTCYHETAGFDLLLVHCRTGVQVGLEAKLALNPKVLVQALDSESYFASQDGPDFRGVLVPFDATQPDLAVIARRLGIGVIAFQKRGRFEFYIDPLPGGSHETSGWHPWYPERRCALPEYVPDVVGGRSAPVRLTEWKIQAIKLLILLDRRGSVTRSDFRHLGISPARWTAPDGYLARGAGCYVRDPDRTPDLRAQHPEVWTKIEADFEKWAPPRPLGAAVLFPPPPQVPAP